MSAQDCNELKNMSFIFSCPVRTGNDKIYPNRTKGHSTAELTELIERISPTEVLSDGIKNKIAGLSNVGTKVTDNSSAACFLLY